MLKYLYQKISNLIFYVFIEKSNVCGITLAFIHIYSLHLPKVFFFAIERWKMCQEKKSFLCISAFGRYTLHIKYLLVILTHLLPLNVIEKKYQTLCKKKSELRKFSGRRALTYAKVVSQGTGAGVNLRELQKGN